MYSCATTNKCNHMWRKKRFIYPIWTGLQLNWVNGLFSSLKTSMMEFIFTISLVQLTHYIPKALWWDACCAPAHRTFQPTEFVLDRSKSPQPEALSARQQLQLLKMKGASFCIYEWASTHKGLMWFNMKKRCQVSGETMVRQFRLSLNVMFLVFLREVNWSVAVCACSKGYKSIQTPFDVSWCNNHILRCIQ